MYAIKLVAGAGVSGSSPLVGPFNPAYLSRILLATHDPGPTPGL